MKSDEDELTLNWLWVPSPDNSPAASQVPGQNSHEASPGWKTRSPQFEVKGPVLTPARGSGEIKIESSDRLEVLDPVEVPAPPSH